MVIEIHKFFLIMCLKSFIIGINLVIRKYISKERRNVMAFLDKLSKKIGDVAESATDKAKDFAETTKLNSAISAEEKHINQYFLDIGKLIFEQEKDNPDSPAAELISKINSALHAIEDIKSKISEIKLDNK